MHCFRIGSLTSFTDILKECLTIMSTLKTLSAFEAACRSTSRNILDAAQYADTEDQRREVVNAALRLKSQIKNFKINEEQRQSCFSLTIVAIKKVMWDFTDRCPPSWGDKDLWDAAVLLLKSDLRKM